MSDDDEPAPDPMYEEKARELDDAAVGRHPDQQHDDDPWPWKMRGELDNEPQPDEARERFGAGTCATGMCIEPCGPNGGCIR